MILDLVESCIYEELDIYPSYYEDDSLMLREQADILFEFENFIHDEIGRTFEEALG